MEITKRLDDMTSEQKTERVLELVQQVNTLNTKLNALNEFDEMVLNSFRKLLEQNELNQEFEDVVRDVIDYNTSLDDKIKDAITDQGYLGEYEVKEIVADVVDDRLEYEIENLEVSVNRG